MIWIICYFSPMKHVNVFANTSELPITWWLLLYLVCYCCHWCVCVYVNFGTCFCLGEAVIVIVIIIIFFYSFHFIFFCVIYKLLCSWTIAKIVCKHCLSTDFGYSGIFIEQIATIILHIWCIHTCAMWKWMCMCVSIECLKDSGGGGGTEVPLNT